MIYANNVLKSGVAITPNDTGDIGATSLYVGVAGDVKVRMQTGEDVLFKAMSAGVIYPIYVTRVYATGTTATNLVGLS